MKFFTNKGVVQKTVIAILIVILTTFVTPAPVQADWGGKLLSPIFAFVTAIFDGIQHLLEMTMLGETESFMKDIGSGTYDISGSVGGSITTDAEIDGSFFGIDAVQVPRINYTPEAIFQNQVPALDINFITPAIKGNDERNTAVQLRGTIASWYLALRSIAVVGLLSVLIYLGIRMLMTSLAADKAKYKKMLMDWVIAICLVLVLHYIMAFALTMAETITAMVSSGSQTLRVTATNIDPHWWSGGGTLEFSSNLMSYVRFMVQAEDLNIKIAFFALYVMLVIYSIRFTWVYLKRVVNMAFLTLMAPMVALTYPIDKVGDGKAQAFNIWLKEYTYNALIQPVHLLLYKVLLGSAIDLAAKNPLYAVVCLGFIIAAEKLVKKMFGFDKASGGTVGSLAAAAGVTTMAGKMLNDVGKKGPAGGNGKIRTKDSGERQGKDDGANKPFKAFKGKDANDVVGGSSQGGALPSPDGGSSQTTAPNAPSSTNGNSGQGENEVPPPPPIEGEETPPSQEEGQDENVPPLPPVEGGGGLPEGEQQDIRQNEGEDLEEEEGQEPADSQNDVPPPPPMDETPSQEQGAPQEEMPTSSIPTVEEPETWEQMRDRDRQAAQERREKKRELKAEKKEQRKRDKESGELARKRKIKAYQAWRGIKAAAPAVAYTAARGTLKTAVRMMPAIGMAAMGGIIGATTGDGEKALSMALGAGAVGFSTGGNMFEATAGKIMQEENIRDAYGAGKYGNRTDARNARADKEYFRSQKFNDFYEKYYKKDGYTKDQVKEFVEDYRKAGITKESDIRRAKALEDKYIKENEEARKKDKNRKELSRRDARAQVQNIVQSYADMDIDKKAYSDEKVKNKEINRISGMLGEAKDEKQKANNDAIARQIFKGYEDWRDTAV